MGDVDRLGVEVSSLETQIKDDLDNIESDLKLLGSMPPHSAEGKESIQDRISRLKQFVQQSDEAKKVRAEREALEAEHNKQADDLEAVNSKIEIVQENLQSLE